MVFKVAGSDNHVAGKMYDYMKAKGINKSSHYVWPLPALEPAGAKRS